MAKNNNSRDKDDFDFKNNFADDINEEERVIMDQWDERTKKQDKMLDDIIPALKELELVSSIFWDFFCTLKGSEFRFIFYYN